jgi:hypothetical protein
MPLLMPYYLNYDLLLLAVPATLFAGMLSADVKSSRWLPWTWIALSAWLYVAMPMTKRFGFNATTPLMAMIAFGLIALACRSAPRSRHIDF